MVHLQFFLFACVGEYASSEGATELVIDVYSLWCILELFFLSFSFLFVQVLCIYSVSILNRYLIQDPVETHQTV